MLNSLTRILNQVRRRRRLGIIIVIVILVSSIAGNSVIFYLFEKNIQPISLWDSLWYSIISITTIGYGDVFAMSLGARIGTFVFIILFGLASLTATIGIMVDWVVEIREKERNGMGKSIAENHLLIVNFPNESRIRQIIEEFTRDKEHLHREIVIVSDQIEKLPFIIPNVSFIRGSLLEQETFKRANITGAWQAIILSTSVDDMRTDSLVASICFIMENMNPKMSIIAECQDPKHAVLFSSSKQVSLVYTTKIANNLLVQEAQDPGVNLLTETITSNITDIEETVVTTELKTIPVTHISYIEAAKRLLDHDVNLVGVIRNGILAVSLIEMMVSQGDSLVYISKNRYTSSELYSFIS